MPAITPVTGASINFAQTYTPEGGWDDNFANASIISYKITFGGTALPDGTASINASGRADGLHTLTQTFYYSGKAVGSRSVAIAVSGNTFVSAFVSEGDLTPVTSIPAITLTLKK